MRSEPEGPDVLPPAPIDRLLAPVQRFLHVEAASGVVLLAATVAALLVANSPWAAGFLALWKTPIALEIGSFAFRHSLKHLINDGLMAIFFFVIGLEVKREIVLGELRELRRAALPIAGAIGGMVVPAAIYLLLQPDPPGRHGWGIPMATDIAFVVGCLAVVGRRVPHGLRIMLLSLAIADDIGAIVVIAIGYTSGVNLGWLAAGLALLGAIQLLGRLGTRRFLVYSVVAALAWYCFHESGVHATIAGVLIGLLTPARSRLPAGSARKLIDRAEQFVESDRATSDLARAAEVRYQRDAARELVSPTQFLIDVLHPWVSFGIMPLFALANAGVRVHVADLRAPIALAAALGLLLGKPIGIVLASLAAVRSGLARLPDGVGWRQMIGGGILSGIGFTMALFIASLALAGELLDVAKVGVLAGSFVAGAAGIALLVTSPAPHDAAERSPSAA